MKKIALLLCAVSACGSLWAENSLPTPQPELAAAAAPAPAGRRMATPCAGEEAYLAQSKDVVLPQGANLHVMFHGNRYPAAADLVEAFENANPGIRVSYTTLPPVLTYMKLDSGHVMIPQGNPGISPEAFTALPRPDVVMVPSGLMDRIGQHLEWPRAWSDISGMVLVKRSGDQRITDLKDLLNREVKTVFAGNQANHHATYSAFRARLTELDIEALQERKTSSYSGMVHHRSVAARILAECADAGLQYAQAQFALEKAYPGKLAFIPVPVTAFEKAQESSVIAVVKETPHRAAANLFRDFVTSTQGQAVLKKYGLESRL